MKPSDDIVSPTGDAAALPRAATKLGVNRTPPQPVPAAPPPFTSTQPTADAVLRWIAAAAKPWFPSSHAQVTGLARADLDGPLNELRTAGLVQVVDWVRGRGQGYDLTEAGAAALAAPAPDSPPPLEEEDSFEEMVFVQRMRRPIATRALLIATLLWYFVGLVIAVVWDAPFGSYLWRGDAGVAARLGSLAAPDLLHDQWWRLIATIFVHGAIWHVLAIAFALVIFGSAAEQIWGRSRHLYLYLGSGLAASCQAMAQHPVDAGTGLPAVLVGASGAICGLATSVAVWLMFFRSRLPAQKAEDLTRVLGMGLVLCLGLSFIPGVSLDALLGGGVFGIVAGLLLIAQRCGSRLWRTTSLVLLVLLPALCVAGLIAAMQTREQWVALQPARISSETSWPSRIRS